MSHIPHIFCSSRHLKEEAVATSHATPEAEDEGSDADPGVHNRLEGDESSGAQQAGYHSCARFPHLQPAYEERR